jgi:hypothetical protein
MSCNSWDLGIRDILQRVRGSDVPSDGSIIKIDLSVDVVIELYILNDGTKSDSVENIRLFLRIKSSDSWIASTLKVEDTLFTNKTIAYVQQCSSSPIKSLFWSWAKVVFPEPDLPKIRLTSLVFSPSVALQCIVRIPCSVIL